MRLSLDEPRGVPRGSEDWTALELEKMHQSSKSSWTKSCLKKIVSVCVCVCVYCMCVWKRDRKRFKCGAALYAWLLVMWLLLKCILNPKHCFFSSTATLADSTSQRQGGCRCIRFCFPEVMVSNTQSSLRKRENRRETLFYLKWLTVHVAEWVGDMWSVGARAVNLQGLRSRDLSVTGLMGVWFIGFHTRGYCSISLLFHWRRHETYTLKRQFHILGDALVHYSCHEWEKKTSTTQSECFTSNMCHSYCIIWLHSDSLILFA